MTASKTITPEELRETAVEPLCRGEAHQCGVCELYERAANTITALRRALVQAEWSSWCDSPVRCTACNGYHPRHGGNHHDTCRIDAALTDAGLPDQKSRDAMRSETAKR